MASATPPNTFQSTLPARGATARGLRFFLFAPDFNPRSPHGERPICQRVSGWYVNFNPRSPHGERQAPRQKEVMTMKFQSTLPARGATASWLSAFAYSCISIHAPRTGSDVTATRRNHFRQYFNPRSPHGERPAPAIIAPPAEDISIHAPRTGSDKAFITSSMPRNLFQSTLPARGATNHADIHPADNPISIHAPRTGSDTNSSSTSV